MEEGEGGEAILEIEEIREGNKRKDVKNFSA
jgi:hypothetical protein